MQTQAPPRLTGLWRNADFLKLWAAQTVSEFGSLLPTLSFVAILALQAAPFQVALLAAATTAPALLFGLVAGVWVDRARRRPVLVVADVGRFVLLGSVPAAYVAGVLRTEQLYLVAFLTGTLTVFFDVAFRSFLPSLVTGEELIEANSKLSATSSAVEVAAFSIGGWLVQWLTAITTTLIDALTFLCSAAFLLRIRMPEPAPRAAGSSASLRREVAEGLSLVWSDSLLRAIAATSTTRNLGGGVIGALIALYGIRELGFQPAVLGMIWAVGGVSSVVGAWLAERVTHRVGLGPAMVYGSLIGGIGTFLIPLAQGPPAVAAALLVLHQLVDDGATTVYVINRISLSQAVTPDRLLGRVNGTFRLLFSLAATVGAVLGGVLAESIGMRPALFVAACLAALGTGCLLLSPVRTLRGLPMRSPV